MSYFNLFSFSSSTSQPTQCSNGVPVNLYEGNGIDSSQVLYSLWNYYQNSPNALFTTQQYINSVPITTSCVGPSNIFIIRHGEKPLSPDANAYRLTENGIYRACNMVNFINSLAVNGTPISYIITYRPNYFTAGISSTSIHAEQTISVSSFMLNIPLFIFGKNDDYSAVSQQLFASSSTNIFNGLNVLICWDQPNIQCLMLSLLNASVSYGRITQANSNAFFTAINPCPEGNYLGDENFTPPAQPQPNQNYKNSQYYPFWNSNNFDSYFWLQSTLPSNIFSFGIYQQLCDNCYNSCPLSICLYQSPNTGNYYDNSDNIESECLPPTKWKV